MLVVKRSGNLQEFDVEKLKRSISAAGASDVEANQIAGEIEAWAKENAEDDKITSQALREKAIEILNSRLPDVALNYENYTKEPETEE